MILSGGGITLTITGKNLKTSVSAEFDRKDLSGQTSSASFSSGGNKAKKINVSLLIEKENGADLTRLDQAAAALDDKLDPVVYTISDDQCEVRNIRQVFFVGSLTSKESDGLQCYDVSFELQEYKSPASKKEERAQAKAVPETKPADGEVKVGSVDHAKVIEAAKS